MNSFRSGRSLFFTLAGAVLLFNLLLMNDVATLWDGAEARFVWQSLFEPAPGYFPHGVTALVSGGALREFWLRLPGLLLLLGGGGAVFGMLAPVLGRPATGWWLLVLGASLLIPQLAKVASADVWSFAFQWTALAALIRFLKQPGWPWRVSFYLLLLGAMWVDPLSSAFFFILFSGWLYWKHPQGKRLGSLQPWLAVVFSGLLVWGSAWLNWQRTGFYIDWAPGRYLLLNLLAVLPFLGFAAAGVFDAIAKRRRGEELALILTVWLVAALLAQSLLLQAGLAFLVAKQLQLYFEPNYPYRSWVRAGAVIHLLLVFFLAMGLMLYGFDQFGGVGFRAAMAFGVVYWMTGLVGVIGLFGMNRRFAWGGTILSGLLAATLFWVQLYPLIESRRDVPQRLAAAAAGADCHLVEPAAGPSNERLYLRAACAELEVTAAEQAGAGVWIVPAGSLPAETVAQDTSVIKGWNDLGREVGWRVVRK